jgi:hypothetical protein
MFHPYKSKYILSVKANGCEAVVTCADSFRINAHRSDSGDRRGKHIVEEMSLEDIFVDWWDHEKISTIQFFARISLSC